MYYACCVVIVLDFTDNNGLLLAIVITRVVYSYVGLYLTAIVPLCFLGSARPLYARKYIGEKKQQKSATTTTTKDSDNDNKRRIKH